MNSSLFLRKIWDRFTLEKKIDKYTINMRVYVIRLIYSQLLKKDHNENTKIIMG